MSEAIEREEAATGADGGDAIPMPPDEAALQDECMRLLKLIKRCSGLSWVAIPELPGFENAYNIRHRGRTANVEDYKAYFRYARDQKYSETRIHSRGTFIHNLIPDTSHLEDAKRYSGVYLHLARSVEHPGMVSRSLVELGTNAWDDRMPKYELLRRKGNSSTSFIGGYIKTPHQLILLGSQEAIVDVRTHFFRVSQGGRETFLDGLVNGVSGGGVLFSGPCCMIKKAKKEEVDLGHAEMSWVRKQYKDAADYLESMDLIKLEPIRFD